MKLEIPSGAYGIAIVCSGKVVVKYFPIPNIIKSNLRCDEATNKSNVIVLGEHHLSTGDDFFHNRNFLMTRNFRYRLNEKYRTVRNTSKLISDSIVSLHK